jgi:hypothetical protein
MIELETRDAIESYKHALAVEFNYFRVAESHHNVTDYNLNHRTWRTSDNDRSSLSPSDYIGFQQKATLANLEVIKKEITINAEHAEQDKSDIQQFIITINAMEEFINTLYTSKGIDQENYKANLEKAIKELINKGLISSSTATNASPRIILEQMWNGFIKQLHLVYPKLADFCEQKGLGSHNQFRFSSSDIDDPKRHEYLK